MKRLAALAAIPLLTAWLIVLGGGHASAVPRAAQPTPSPTQTCILIIFCSGGSSSPGPSASASASSPAPSASASAPGASGTATPTGPTPTAGPTATPSPHPSPSPSPSASATPSATGSPSPAVTPTRGGKRKVTPKDGSVAPGLVAPSVTWVMTVDSATMTKFTYLGNVNMPVAGGGTVLMMEFEADSMAMSGITTVITENGLTGKETDAGFTASGVTMYATRLSGSLFGAAPVTFTPQNASVLGIANLFTGLVPVTMTGVTADQAMIIAAQAQKTGVAAVG